MIFDNYHNNLVNSYTVIKRISGRVFLIVDGIKCASDGRFMPCINKMIRESFCFVRIRSNEP